jgi:ribonuclease-3
MSDALMQTLGYTFNEAGRLQIALTHRSCGGEHNERYEFLGDSVVNFVIAEALFHQFPEASEGELSRWRASLVNRDTLAHLAKHFDLGAHLLLGPGELRSGGHLRESILSCAMEAIVGAVYLDGGFEKARERIMHWYRDLLKNLLSAAEHKDPKTVLQEFLQAQRLPLPIYSVEKITGEAHKQHFTVNCQVEGLAEKSQGVGTSRRRAEQDAASVMLSRLKK